MVRYVVLGGGVGGVTCAEELSRLATPNDDIFLISESRILKIVTNVQAISKTTETFDLIPTDLEHYRGKPNFHVLQGNISHIDRINKTIITSTGIRYPYDKLCLATGARPKVLFHHPNVIGIRDIESVDELCSRLSRARRVLVVGNGGIALELLNEIRRVPLIWAIKDTYLGNTFLDAGASAFFMPHLFTRMEPQPARLVPSPSPRPVHRHGVTNVLNTGLSTSTSTSSSSKQHKRKSFYPNTNLTHLKHGGAALGPAWRTNLVVPVKPTSEAFDRDLIIESESMVAKIWTKDEYIHIKKRRRVHRNGSPAPSTSLNSFTKPILSTSTDGTDILSTSDDTVSTQWEEQAGPVSDSSFVRFIPHVGRFGEGQLGLTAREDLQPGELPRLFPASVFNETSPSSTTTSVGTESSPDTLNQSDKDDWPLYVGLTNNKVYGVDFMISATGVIPNSELADACELNLDTGSTRGILVDKAMRTSDRDVFAVGDCVTCNWHPRPLHWFQMRLWSQARLMGLQAARYMVRDALIDRAVNVVPSGTIPLSGLGLTSRPQQPTPVSPFLNSPAALGLHAGIPEGVPLFEANEENAMTLDSINSISSHDATSSSVDANTNPTSSPCLNGLSGSPSALGTTITTPPVISQSNHNNIIPTSNIDVPSGSVLSQVSTTVILASGERRTLPPGLDGHFELFAHVSRFFGFKVVLLGLFNAQGLAPGTYDVLVRSTHPGEYVKLVKDRATNQLRGAMLIGETDLEETFENLILTGADVSFLEEVVMEPDMDLEIPIFEDEHTTYPSTTSVPHPPDTDMMTSNSTSPSDEALIADWNVTGPKSTHPLAGAWPSLTIPHGQPLLMDDTLISSTSNTASPEVPTSLF